MTIADLEKLEREATPGSWKKYHMPLGFAADSIYLPRDPKLPPEEAMEQTRRDLAFVHAARMMVPMMIEWIAELRGILRDKGVETPEMGVLEAHEMTEAPAVPR